jgi:hypothetical protein
LMKMFEDYLGRSGPSSETADYIKEAVVIVGLAISSKNLADEVVVWSTCTTFGRHG